MKTIKVLITLMVLLGLSSGNEVYARDHHFGGGFGGHHGHGGFYAGPIVGFNYGFRVSPYYAPYSYPYYNPYYAPPYYAYPPAINVAPAPPPVYIQRDDVASSSAHPADYWYYCRSSEGYYPYVKECPGGWVPVPPRPTVR